MNVKKFGLIGIGSSVQLGKGGARIKHDAGAVEVRNAADAALAVLRAADPVGDSDLVTKKYLESRASIIVSGQIDGGAVPTPADGVVYIVTSAGGAYSLGELYRREAGAWVALTLVDGLVVSIASPLTGGAVSYTLGRYQYDLDTTAWVFVGPVSETSKSDKNEVATLLLAQDGVSNIGAVIPSGSIIKKVIVAVTQAFDGAAPVLDIGDAGDADRFMTAAESDLRAVGVYVTDCYHLYGADTQILATLNIDASTVGQASVLVEYRLA